LILGAGLVRFEATVPMIQLQSRAAAAAGLARRTACARRTIFLA
jgi:hypothetical protein